MTAVTLLTDFGTADGYVGEMKGVLLSGGAGPLVDVSHDVEQGDVRGGAWALRRVWGRFPRDTVHLVVVDPGVGSDRRAVAVRADGRWFVGPDNGVLTRVLHATEAGPAVELDPGRAGLEPVSDTFHGRDLFAPAAARLATGAGPGRIGEPLDPAGLERFEVADPTRTPGGGIRGEVWHVDRFGNLVTNVPVEWLPARPVARVAGTTVRGLSGSFADVEPGGLLLTRGSLGTLELSVRDGSAARALSVGRGARVEVEAGDGASDGSGGGR